MVSSQNCVSEGQRAGAAVEFAAIKQVGAAGGASMEMENPADCVLNGVLEELRLWLMQEDFGFDLLPTVEAVNDSVVKVLKNLQLFLKEAEQSLDRTLLKWFSSAFQSERKMLDYIWWKLGNDKNPYFEAQILGKNLNGLRQSYSSGLKGLYHVVEYVIHITQQRKEGTLNEEAIKSLEYILDKLQIVRHLFQDWDVGVRIEEIREGFHKQKQTQLLSPDEIMSIVKSIDWLIRIKPYDQVESPEPELANPAGKSPHVTKDESLAEPGPSTLSLPTNNGAPTTQTDPWVSAPLQPAGSGSMDSLMLFEFDPEGPPPAAENSKFLKKTVDVPALPRERLFPHQPGSVDDDEEGNSSEYSDDQIPREMGRNSASQDQMGSQSSSDPEMDDLARLGLREDDIDRILATAPQNGFETLLQDVVKSWIVTED